jgi:two-component system chemotaxis response regulator CheB
MEDGDAAEPPQAVTEARTSGSRLPEPAAAPVPGRPRNMVVLGASAGGVEALRRVVSGLPPDLPAAVCVVLHIAPGGPSALAGILGRCGPLPCRAVRGRERLREGEILVAPPDRHIMIESGRKHLL